MNNIDNELMLSSSGMQQKQEKLETSNLESP